MKMNKWFMLGMVGLAFTACSNEEELGSKFPAGNGAVSIKIVSPTITKAIEAGNGTDVTVVPAVGSNVVITLTDKNAEGEDVNRSITLSADAWTAVGTTKKVTFWNVTNPQKVTVSMNDGKDAYTSDAIEGADLQKVANVPAYGETASFTATANSGSADLDNENDETQGTGTEEGGTDETTVYQIYTATVQMAIPVARLEVSGIKHIITGSHETGNSTGNCKYKTLTIAGVYLDNVIPTGEGVSYSNGAFSCSTGTPLDYCFSTDDTGTGNDAILEDAVEAPEETNFLTADAVWPAGSNAFGYNFFGVDGATKLPQFKIYFSNSEPADNQTIPDGPRYAIITKYWNVGRTEQITKFEPGHIYRITSATLSDENIIGDEGGNTLYGVEVTVTEAQWKVENIEGEWVEQ